MLRQLVCYRRFFPFYLRTPSQSLLSRTSASQCLILLVTPMFSTGGGPDICHYVFCRQVVYLQTFTYFFFTYFAVRSSIYIFLTCFVVRSSIYIFCALMLLISVWNFRWRIDEKNFRKWRFLQRHFSVTEVLFCYKDIFRIWFESTSFKSTLSLSLLIAGCWFSDWAFCIYPCCHICSPVWGQVVKSWGQLSF